MRRIMRDELFDEPVHLVHAELAPFSYERAFDQRARAAADQVARGLVSDRRQTLAGEDSVERDDEIGRAVDQRAVEIEDDRRSPHHW